MTFNTVSSIGILFRNLWTEGLAMTVFMGHHSSYLAPQNWCMYESFRLYVVAMFLSQENEILKLL